MKLTAPLFLALAISPLMMMQTCIKDSEETYEEESDAIETYYDPTETVTKTMAIENWEMFLKHSQNTIDAFEINMGILEMRMDDADADESTQWQQVLDAGSLSVIKLKSRRQKRDKEFTKELKAYDASSYEKNAAFEKEFNREMAQTNAELAKLMDKIRSGYYK